MDYVFHKIGDLKNRARKLAREEDLPHHEALDMTALRGGYQNYAHALRQLPETIELPTYRIEVGQRWWERETRQGGQATATAALRTPLAQLVKSHQLIEYLGGCQFDGKNRLVSSGRMRDRQESRNDVGRVVRTLQFMDATDLKPSSARRGYPKGDWDHRPPIADHDSTWYDPEQRAHILVTQPYPGRADRHDTAQLEWEARHGWQTLQTSWGSLYGFGTEFYLLCPNEYAEILRRKLAKLERSPAALANDDVTESLN
jgi:hypothetical protein